MAKMSMVDRACGHENVVTAIAFSPRGNGFATGDEDGQIILWNYPDVGDGEEKRWSPLDFPIWALAFAADGRVLAAGGRKSSVELINTVDGTRDERTDLRKGYIRSLAFSPTENNLLAIGTEDASVIFVETST